MANYLPVMLSDPVMTWLISLPADSIDSWDDLKKAFIENYRSTYKRPSSKFDLARMYQKSGETLRSFIQRFSEKRNSIPNIAEVEVINAFKSHCPQHIYPDPCHHDSGIIPGDILSQ